MTRKTSLITGLVLALALFLAPVAEAAWVCTVYIDDNGCETGRTCTQLDEDGNETGWMTIEYEC